MAGRGRKKRSVAELALAGSWRAKGRRDLTLPVGRLVCPAWLSPGAKKIWHQIVPELRKTGAICRIDTNAITRYCDGFARWKNLAQRIAEMGMTIETESGVKQCPELGVLLKLENMLSKLESVLGLTPAARVGLHISDTNGNNKTKFFRDD